MKCKRKGLEVNAIPYEQNNGLEDGFELLRDVIVNGWITTDLLVKIIREDGSTVCPYISNRRGRSFIAVGDYIINELDGERHVCGKDKFLARFEKIEE